MKVSITMKFQGLLVGVVLLVGLSVCTVSYLTFNNGFSAYAHNEIVTAKDTVQSYVSELGSRSAGVASSFAERPDLIAAIKKRDFAAIKTITRNAEKQLQVDFITISDTEGKVLGRGHQEKLGDSVMNQQNVVNALAGKETVGVEDGMGFELCAGVPIYDEKRIIGVATAGYDLGTENFVDTVKRNYAIECTVFKGETRIATTVTDNGGKRIIGSKIENKKIIDKVLNQAETYLGRNIVTGKEFDTSYWPIKTSDGKTVGMYLVAKDQSLLNGNLRGMLRISLIMTIVIGILTVLLSYFFVRSIINPLKRATVMLKDISEGSGDLTKRLDTQTHDEIADMITYFNLTLDKVKDLVVEIENQSSVLSEIGVDLSSNMTETAASVSQISSNIQSIKNQTVNQSASVVETNSTMDQIKLNIEKLNAFIAQQSMSVTQSSSAIEEMLANIASVTKTLGQNAKNIDELSTASGKGRSDLTEVSDVIRQIAHDSEGLIEINSIIETIASQTNLLSMNAAIEAAHAGNSGKGFAVVADEIRKLAESASAQAKTIASVLNTMKSSIDRITVASDVVQNQFESIDQKIKTLAELEDGIRRAMEEQSAGSKEILAAIGQLNDITVQVKDGSDEMLTGSEEVAKESGNLGRITEEVSGSMTEMAAGIEQITTAIHSVNGIAQSNKDCIAVLREKISKFKIA